MNKFKKIMNNLLSYLTAFLLIVMTALVLWQVFTRYILNNPSVFTEELVRIILIWSSFLGASYAFGTRQHMALVFFKEKSKGLKKKAIYVFIDVMILGFAILVLIKGGYQLASGVMGIKTPILGISRGLIYMIAPFSGIIITIYQLMNIKEDIEMVD
ncbi:TRAP transporter small permease [Alkaliphilus peptidifermentans]|uniref:TRAP-type C4-dicarboxylate transport system, small permease component n=1 Tax=Alkaliphilus peptidifermentans DSM 18978 TaxID=1120976 RepID=A0A1G5CBN6_9FIRM|nr:TRAP transporter small permease [Alkaliphilus peptidifermentans]SCX99751.1 TRAP-type C4-dicarboxylate transport system, small permease component [Alkaliphilus peptidifermentans DSM 18978]